MQASSDGCSIFRIPLSASLIILSPLLIAGCNQQSNDVPDTSIVSPPATSTVPAVQTQPDTFPKLTKPNELPAPQDHDFFEDVTTASGVEHTYQSGIKSEQYTMIEGLGGGIALFDYDADNDLDLLCAGGGTISKNDGVSGLPCELYRNDGDFKFVNVTEQVGLNLPLDYNHGLAVADVDQDGYPDLFVSCYGRSHLLRNVDGQSFVDVTPQMGLELQGWHTTCLFADFNQDSLSDLFVTGYLDWNFENQPQCSDPHTKLRDVCLPSNFEPARDYLLINRGSFKFEDASEQFGIRNDGKGLGAIAGDFNSDQLLDLYVANDVTDNFYYTGLPQGGLQEVGLSSGLSGNEYGNAEGSMGVASADVNRDGRLDLFVTNFEIEDNSFYLNEGKDLFVHATARSGLAGNCRLLVGFGTQFLDINADGWEDLVLVNGHLVYRNRISDYQQQAFVFLNDQGKFTDQTSAAGPWFQVPHSGRGLATGDLNNDGAIDLVISEQDGPVTILKNRSTPEHWLGIQLEAKENGDLTGAVVTWHLPDLKISKQILSGGSYLSHSDERLLFYPPAKDTIPESLKVTVQWPDNSKEQFEALKGNAYQILKQETGSSTKPDDIKEAP